MIKERHRGGSQSVVKSLSGPAKGFEMFVDK